MLKHMPVRVYMPSNSVEYTTCAADYHSIPFNATLIIEVQLFLPPFPWSFITCKGPFLAPTSLHGSFISNMHFYAVGMQLRIKQLVNIYHVAWTTQTMYRWIEICTI